MESIFSEKTAACDRSYKSEHPSFSLFALGRSSTASYSILPVDTKPLLGLADENVYGSRGQPQLHGGEFELDPIHDSLICRLIATFTPFQSCLFSCGLVDTQLCKRLCPMIRLSVYPTPLWIAPQRKTKKPILGTPRTII